MEIRLTQDYSRHLDRQAAQQIAMAWTRHQSAVFSFIRSLVPTYHDAEDILQRVAAAVIEKHDQYEPDRPFIAWAIGLARIEVMRHRQSRQRSRLIFSDNVVEQLAQTYVQQHSRLDDMSEALESCMKRLPAKSRRVIELHYLRSMSGKAIAEALGVTSNAVFVMLHRIRQALRKCIEQQITEACA